MIRLKNQRYILWLIPVAVAIAFAELPTKDISALIGASLALLLVVFMVTRPGVALITLVIFLPLQLLGFSLLLTLHVPASILRPASSLKELLALSILIAGLRQLRDTNQRLDRIDIAVLAYVGVVTIYLLVPHLFSSIAPTSWSPRILAWRSDAGYPLIFFGARHAPIRPEFKDRFIRVIMVMGGLTAFLGLYQRLAPQSWSNFVLNHAQVAVYEFKVLGLAPSNIVANFPYIYIIKPLRVSSIFLSPFDMSDYLVLVIAVAAVRIASNRQSPFNYVVLAAAMGSIVFSVVRADALAAVIVLVLIALPTSRNSIEGRLRVIVTLVLAAVIIVPSLSGSRFVGAQGANVSTSKHVNDVKDAFGQIETYPLGLGLGSLPSSGTRFNLARFNNYNEDITQNVFTQVSFELGLEALLPWLIMMTFVLLALKRRAGDGDMFAAAMGFGLLGVVLAGLGHHVFLAFPVPWTIWCGAGLALSANQVQKPEELPDRWASHSVPSDVR
jgi:hypothetical protein